jgi:hypothetical protein
VHVINYFDAIKQVFESEKVSQTNILKYFTDVFLVNVNFDTPTMGNPKFQSIF